MMPKPMISSKSVVKTRIRPRLRVAASIMLLFQNWIAVFRLRERASVIGERSSRNNGRNVQ